MSNSGGGIAIIGAGLRFPGGVRDLGTYWDLLRNGVDAVGPVPRDRWSAAAWPEVPAAGGFLHDVATFDADFYRISPREALELDPAQRLLLDVAWEALENAALAPDQLARSRTGVYVGLGLSDYGRRHFLHPDPDRMTAYSGTGSFLSVAAGRISYTLGLQGPAMTVDTACSSSLVSVHLAVQALRRGEVDAALAGGANLILSPEPSLYFARLDALAADGRCKTFSAHADGYGRGEGAALVVLKRLADARADGDPILAVIRGSAVNQDGRTNGLTAPSAQAQQAVIRAALADSGVEPGEVGLIEAHGTGTPLGDPIEMSALRAVLGGREAGPVRVGSVKANFGHTETAAGIAGILKVAAAIQHATIPPHLHADPLNPRIKLEGTALEIPTEAVAWADDVRVGGVSSFGLSGTNAHVVLASPPVTDRAPAQRRPVELITLSARGEGALAATAARWATELADAPLADVAYTSHVGRAALADRLGLVARSSAEAAERLARFASGEDTPGAVVGTASSREPGVAFLFTGQGAQTAGMGRRLYDSDPQFAVALDDVVASVDAALGGSITEVMWGDDDRLHDTRFTQPALFALEVALARWWATFGIEPDWLIGHSIGEIAAATVAGVMTVADGASLVVARGKLMSELPRDGAMVALFADVDAVTRAIGDRPDVAVAGVNGPTETVISGSTDAVAAVADALEAKGTRVRRLTVSHAFHSHLMDPMLDAFREVARGVALSPAQVPLVSNVDGRFTDGRETDPEYWVQHVREAVRFADGFGTLVEDGATVFLEIGPRPVLCGMGRRCAPDAGLALIGSLHPERPDPEMVAEAQGALWVRGVTLDRSALHPTGERLVLPPTVRVGQRFWIDPPAAAPLAVGAALQVGWRPYDPTEAPLTGNWVVLGSDDVARALAARGATVHREWVDVPDGVVVAPTGSDPVDLGWQATEACQRLVRSVGNGRLWFLPRPDEHPATAALLGVGRVIALEHPERWGATIEVHDGAVEAAAQLVGVEGEDWVRASAAGVSCARLEPAESGPGVDVSGGPIWITGGFGALGARVARWLADRGAAHLVLTGRQGPSTEHAQGLVEELRERGLTVTAEAADAAVPADVDRVLAAAGAPLLGVVHAAGVNDDGGLMQQTWPRFEAVIRPKVEGARVIHEATADHELAFFVLFSSAAGVLGTPGQANYAAANAVLDAFASWRRAQGKPATSIAWGPWEGAGMAGDVPDEVRARWSREGVVPLEPAQALEELGRHMGGAPAVLVAPFDWSTFRRTRPAARWLDDLGEATVVAPEPAHEGPPARLVDTLVAAPAGARPRMMADHVLGVVSRVLGRSAERPVRPDEGFFDAGMDSLMAMELRERLQSGMGRPLSATVAFDFPTVARMSAHLLEVAELTGPAPAADAPAAADPAGPIAIVGASCRLPGGADDLDALWDRLERGIDAIREVPPDRFDIDRYYDPTPDTPGRTVSRHGGFIEGIDQFDPQHFGIAPREAAALDPQQRLLLELSWHALEDAAVAPRSLAETATGVFVGVGASEYGLRFDPTTPDADLYAGTGNEGSFAAGRVAYALRLQGPAMSVNTACSSSLVAVHLAVQALRRGECSMALAGGVNAIVGPETTLWLSRLGALAPDGRCKAFDSRADGYVRAEGGGVIVLKPLAAAERDGDRILAVIRGSAVNHDGPSAGLTVPNGRAQQQVVRAALADAGVAPDEVGLIECHGTGTPLGDPIEVQALGEVFGDRREPLHLGTIKANMGHLEAGAGIAGLLKAVATVQRGVVPRLVHLETPNPELPLDRFPALVLPTAATPWDSDRRIAGVSSFGISGTNAHVVLEQAPAAAARPVTPPRPHTLVTLSSRTADGLAAQGAVLAEAEVELADLALTQNVGRAGLAHRGAVVGSDLAAVRAGLRSPAIRDVALPDASVVFLCTGAGPQEAGMARDLYDHSAVFRAALDEAAAAADVVLDVPLLDVMFPSGEARPELHDLTYTQPAMFALQWAMAALWRSVGVEPAAVIGHSTGQFVAACLAGVFDLATGIQLMARRAALMSSVPRDGAMVSLLVSEATVRAALEDVDPGGADTAIAAINGPEEVVISGRAEPVEAVAARLEADGIEVRRLNISHAAHSPLMDPILDDFEALMGSVPLAAPAIPLIENVRGAIAGAELQEPAYWRRHMREPVQFHAGLETLADLGHPVFLELGNHPVLAGMAARALDTADPPRMVASLRRSQPDWATLLEAVGRLWARGVQIDWHALHADQPGAKVSLPGTQFVRSRHWVERSPRRGSGVVGADWVYEARWIPQRPNVEAAGTKGLSTMLVLADAGGLGERLAARQERPVELVPAGTAETTDAIEALLAEHQPGLVVSLRSLDAAGEVSAAAQTVTEHALALVQAAMRHDTPVWWISRGAMAVGDDEAPDLAQAAALGLLTTAALELDLPLVRLDLDPSQDPTDSTMVEMTLNGGHEEDQIAVRGMQQFVRRLGRAPVVADEGTTIPSVGTTLITGGLGAIGLRVARWAASQGAPAIVLVTRSQPDDDAAAAIDALDAREGLRCQHVALDVGAPDAVPELLRLIEAAGLPPVAALFHAAGVVEDGALATLQPAALEAVWPAKVRGTLALHEALPEAAPFVLFSSAASMIGSAGQAPYAAANAFLDAVAQVRRSAGSHGLAIGYGPWAGAGLAARSSRAWEAGGVRPLAPALAMQVLEQQLGATAVAVVDLDWQRWPHQQARIPALVADLVAPAPMVTPSSGIRAVLARTAPDQRTSVIADRVAELVGSILGLPAADVDRGLGFSDAGMDSLMAVELAKRLRAEFDPSLPVTIAFDHPTVDAVVAQLAGETETTVIARDLRSSTDLDQPIAIVGLSCRMPGGANDPELFWELLRSGRDPMEEVPPRRWDLSAWYDPVPGTLGKMYTREAGFVDFDLIEGFDADFFGISGREAASLDPQQRMLLEVSYEALERAGIPVDGLGASHTGVYVGVGDSGYLQRFQGPGDPLYSDLYAGTGSLAAFVSGRLAYSLGLQGPNLALNTACSSSLVAVHLAIQALRAGECDLALAGGVHLMLSPENFVYVSQLTALSPDGRCKTFDAAADGYGRAEGCGMVALKRLDDAERDGSTILAVIRGSALGHDGRSSGLTVPNGPAQQQVLAGALAQSGLAATDVSYLEAHGTGTELGDPIEVHAAEAVYGAGRTADNPLHIGAVKSNVGHLEVAAGAASLVKVVMALQHAEIPPHLHYSTPNPDLDLDAHHLVVDTAPTEWAPPGGIKRAGVSAFGLAGTNVHLVLEEAPPRADVVPDLPDRGTHVLPVSARSEGALRALAAALGERLAHDALSDIAHASGTRRAAHPYRLAVTADDAASAATQIAQYLAHGDAPGVFVGTASREPRLALLFSGQGSQYPGMGRGLYDTFPAYREVIDAVAAAVDPLLPRPLRDVLHGTDDAVHDTTFTQPALYAHEVALAALWQGWGLAPAAVAGHSIGQFAAAAVAGVFSVEDGARLVAERGRLMGALPPGGAMVAIFAEEAVVVDALVDGASVAAVNHPDETVVSGDVEAVDAVAAALAAAGHEVRALTVSHAFHSARMDPILEPFLAVLREVRFSAPRIPVMCNGTGEEATAADLQSPDYWRTLVRQPVRFADNLTHLATTGHRAFIEIGPHRSLLGMGHRTVPDRDVAWIPSQRRGAPAVAELMAGVGQAWVAGLRVDWAALDAPWPRRSVDLPTYPWQRRRHWIDKPEWPLRPTGQADADWFVGVSWEPRPLPPAGVSAGRWVVTGPGADQGPIRSALTDAGATVVEVEGPDDVDLTDATRVLYIAGAPDPAALPVSPSAEAQIVAQWVRALVRAESGAALRIVTHGAIGLGAAVSAPLAGSLWGLARVIRLEHPELDPVVLDLPPDGPVEGVAALLDASDEPEHALRDDQRWVPRLDRITVPAAPPLSAGTVLVTGGLRGLGLEVARSLADRGATHLVLMGRSAPSPETSELLETLRDQGTEVMVARGDVAVRDDVLATVGAIPEHAPLRGIVHAAGILRDGSLLRLDDAAFAEVYAPKVQGTWNLHDATAHLELDFFLLFSGGASLLGSPGQGNYAAANAFLDAFAHWAREHGRPVTSVNWGAWAEVGMAARLGQDHANRQASEGIRPLPLAGGLEALHRIRGSAHAQVGVMAVDWPQLVRTFHRGQRPPFLERLAAEHPADATPPAPGGLPLALAGVRDPDARLRVAVEHVERRARSVLKLDPARPLDPAAPLLDSGLDSLLAVELKNRLADDGVDVPVARVMTGPSVDQLAALALRTIDEAAPVAIERAPELGAPAVHPIVSHVAALVIGAVGSVLLYALTVWANGGPAPAQPQTLTRESAEQMPQVPLPDPTRAVDPPTERPAGTPTKAPRGKARRRAKAKRGSP